MPLPARNLLARETSPYLRQHRDNPVHWRGWSTAALAEAVELDRPILLSVGYAACHWCHVMAHECFEDPEVADVMNRLFVNIKVDREERPDVDQIYIASLGAMGEQGGWPLTMFLTPDAQPFWGGTYFPREARYGRPGFVQVLQAVHRAWTDKRSEVRENAGVVSEHVSRRLAPVSPAVAPEKVHLAKLSSAILGMIDQDRGGLRGAPKFPNAPFMTALWLQWLEAGDPAYRKAFLDSLSSMADGGIYDHVGGGLCRYSTDADWLVPHFEKMLYDNALFLRHCCWAWVATKDKLFRKRIENTVAWLLREMQLVQGGFASSLDADSGGVEGSFYTWTRDQVADALGDDAEVFFREFALGTAEHWEGDPVLFRRSLTSSPAVDDMLNRLRNVRESRIRPGRDDKVLVDWNGLVTRALAEAGRIFGRQEWVAAARRAYHFVLESSDRDGRLPHSILESQRLFPAMSTDYASMINAALALGEATGDAAYMRDARKWLDMLDIWYGDSAGGHFLTSSDSRDVPMRIRGDVDEAVPSATSQIIEAFVRMAGISDDPSVQARADAVAALGLGRTLGQTYGQAGTIAACALGAEAIKLVISDVHYDTSALVSVANRYPDPRRMDVFKASADEAEALLPQRQEHRPEIPAAYYCTGQSCLPVIADHAELEHILRRSVRLA